MKKFALFLLIMTLSPILGAQVKLGIDVLQRHEFQCLKKKRVGLLTHPAGVNSKGESTIDILYKDKRVNLVALFGPEHGIYGNEKAERKVDDCIDSKTGLRVYSLYGKNRRPSPEMLKAIDVMVIDLQDIGTRSYTYISCMCYTMEECFKHNIEVIVLDRPNPLGGLKVDGPILEQEWKSYVGALRIPYVHGLTIGEIAWACKQEPDWLAIPQKIRENGKLSIVRMQGWNRTMMWPETGLKWVATSPAITSFDAVLGYPMTGLGCQLGGFLHGYGTEDPFRLLSFRNKKPYQIEKILKAKNIPGINYEKRKSFNPNTQKYQEGLYIKIHNFKTWNPTELSFHLMKLACEWGENKNPFATDTESNINLFNKHVGSTAWWKAISTSGNKVNLMHFLTQWKKDAKQFQTWSKQYWLY